MCGILVSCQYAADQENSVTETLLDWQTSLSSLRRRGPDKQNVCRVGPYFEIAEAQGSIVCRQVSKGQFELIVQVQTHSGAELDLGSTLLHLRGDHSPALPYRSANNDVLLFNGMLHKTRPIQMLQSRSDMRFTAPQITFGGSFGKSQAPY